LHWHVSLVGLQRTSNRYLIVASSIAIEMRLFLWELKRVRRQVALASLLRVSFPVNPHPSAPLLLAVAVTTTFIAASHAASAMVIWRAI